MSSKISDEAEAKIIVAQYIKQESGYVRNIAPYTG